MSLHDLMAQDLHHVLSDTAHGFAVRAELAGQPITGLMTWEDVEVAGLQTMRSTFRVAEASMPAGKARETLYGATLVVYEAQPYGTRRYVIQSVEPESHGEVLLILKEATA